MEIDILKLNSKLVSSVPFSITYSFSKEELEGTDLISLNEVSIKGEVLSQAEDYQVIADVSGEMVLPCAITLKPVVIPFSITIDEYFNEFMEESLEKKKKIENKLDIFPIIWENILMEIPVKVVSEEARNLELKGDGWRLITEEE